MFAAFYDAVRPLTMMCCTTCLTCDTLMNYFVARQFLAKVNWKQYVLEIEHLIDAFRLNYFPVHLLEASHI